MRRLSDIIQLLTLFFCLWMVSCQEKMNVDGELPTGLIEDLTITIDNLERAYHLYVPSNYVDKPIVVLLHGNRSSHDDIIGERNITSPHKVWLTLAEENKFLVLIPNGTLGSTNNRGWNDCRSDSEGNPDSDDVRFIDELLSFIHDEYAYDTDRIYVTGTSNGGHMAYRLAVELPEKVAAFAAIASSITANSMCVETTTPVSALFMNGTDDAILPYDGGEMLSSRGKVLSTQESIDYWVARNQTSIAPAITNITDTDLDDGSTAIKYLYSNGIDNTEVALYEIVGGGHTEPSILERFRAGFLVLVGNQNGDLEMAEEAWSFFQDKHR